MLNFNGYVFNPTSESLSNVHFYGVGLNESIKFQLEYDNQTNGHFHGREVTANITMA